MARLSFPGYEYQVQSVHVNPYLSRPLFSCAGRDVIALTNNLIGKYMTALDLKLPRHLYTEALNEDGKVTDVTYLHDRLINWFDHGKGLQNLCQSVYENELDDIAGWEEEQLMLLEEQWLEIESGEDDDDNEEQYHLACDAVTREADERRAVAESQMGQRYSEIEQLVSRCAEHIEEHAPETHASHAAEYTLAVILIVVVTFVLL